MIDGIKVDFVHHPFELVEPAFHENQIIFLGIKDIAAMKLHAIETSGNRAKDFVDIHFLLKEMTLKKMFKYYRKKYSTEAVPKLKFWNSYLRFKRKSRRKTTFSRACSKTNRVLEQAQLTIF